MLDGPFDGHAQCPPGQDVSNHFERADIDQYFVFGVERVKVRRMLASEHLDKDAEKLADCRHAPDSANDVTGSLPYAGQIVHAYTQWLTNDHANMGSCNYAFKPDIRLRILNLE